MTTLLLALLAASPARAEPWAWYGELCAQIGGASAGCISLRASRRPWTLGWYTDTLEARFAPDLPRGRAWLAVRAEAGAAGLFLARWTDGRRDPPRSHFASYASVEGGVLRYLGAGFYVGQQVTARYWLFHAGPNTAIEVPDPVPVLTAEVVGGYWSPALEARVTAGADARPGRWAPHVAAEGRWHPALPVGPLVEVRAGAGHDKDDVTRTRLGGINPYVVPLAGAGWAEFWVEDYAALRAGPRVEAGDVAVAAVVDAAWFDGGRGVGFAALADWTPGRALLQAHLGWAPGIPRPPRTTALSVWLRAGLEWGRRPAASARTQENAATGHANNARPVTARN